MVGVKIKKLREERGWTLDELAKKSRVNRMTIWLMENEKQKTANIKTYQRLAKAFEVDIRDLI